MAAWYKQSRTGQSTILQEFSDRNAKLSFVDDGDDDDNADNNW